MGASGCGKSSLLNMVAARIRSKGGVISGSILFNGEGLPEQARRFHLSALLSAPSTLRPEATCSGRRASTRRGTQVVRNVVGYVTQHDHLLPLLTVRETLSYAARLRMPEEMPEADKLRRVGVVVRDLGLKARVPPGFWVLGSKGRGLGVLLASARRRERVCARV